VVDPDDCAVAENLPIAYRTPAARRIDDEFIHISVLVMTFVLITTADASMPSNDINAVRCALSSSDDTDVMLAAPNVKRYASTVAEDSGKTANSPTLTP
jgi:hypothetical protein